MVTDFFGTGGVFHVTVGFRIWLTAQFSLCKGYSKTTPVK